MGKLKEMIKNKIVVLKNFRIIWSNPFIFAEEKSVQMLEDLAKEGWQVKRIWLGGLLYVVEYEEPTTIKYYFDSQPNPTENYYETFQLLGWKLVDSTNGLHLYCAQEGTEPIERDAKKLQVRFHNESLVFRKYSFIIVISLIISFLAWVFIDWAIIQNLLIGILIILLIGFVATFTPYTVYKWRIQKLRNSERN